MINIGFALLIFGFIMAFQTAQARLEQPRPIILIAIFNQVSAQATGFGLMLVIAGTLR